MLAGALNGLREKVVLAVRREVENCNRRPCLQTWDYTIGSESESGTAIS